MENIKRRFLLHLMLADVQKRACGSRCCFLPGILVVESAENRTGEYLQFPLWGYEDYKERKGTVIGHLTDRRDLKRKFLDFRDSECLVEQVGTQQYDRFSDTTAGATARMF